MTFPLLYSELTDDDIVSFVPRTACTVYLFIYLFIYLTNEHNNNFSNVK